jgi:LacI family transcriptional regulator
VAAWKADLSEAPDVLAEEGIVITLRDVARLAGVSIATASAVINNKNNVSEKSKQRVKGAMEALDYHPDQVARSLKVRRTDTIGIVFPDVRNPFFTDVMQGVEAEARRSGYSVIMCNANEDPELERLHLSRLFSRRVDGVLLAPTDHNITQDRLTLRRFPLVYFDRIPQRFAGSAVITDNLGASRDAAKHLIGLGHERIAIITGRLDLPNAQDRLEGFRQALQEAHLPLRDEYLRHGDFRLESGYQCGLHLMHLPDPPTAIFSCNNQMTLGLMRALGELSVRCPAQVSVLGFDDFDWAANFSPQLTTIAQPAYEMGKQATELLVGKMQRGKEAVGQDEERVIVLKNELRIRDSTAAPCKATSGLKSASG